MWYTLPDSNKQYPVTIERVRKIKQLNAQGVIPEELEAVDITTNKPKESESGFVELVGQISLNTLEKADRKSRPQQGNRGNNPQQRSNGPQSRQGGNNNPNQQQRSNNPNQQQRPNNPNQGNPPQRSNNPQSRPPGAGGGSNPQQRGGNNPQQRQTGGNNNPQQRARVAIRNRRRTMVVSLHKEIIIPIAKSRDRQSKRNRKQQRLILNCRRYAD